MGLFTSKTDLFKWQQLVMPNATKLVMDKKQLQEASKLRASNLIKIIQDSIKIVNTTDKPDTFFKRLDMLQEKAFELTLLEPYIKFSGESPSKSYNQLMDQEQDAIHDFLRRYLHTIETKVDTLKTNNAKQRQYFSFYTSLQPYFHKMNEDNLDYIEFSYASGYRLYE